MFPYAEMPKSGFTGHGGSSGYTEKDVATSHNVATTSDYAVFPLGTIIKYFNESLHGYGACAYLTCTEATSDAIVVGDCVTLTAGSHTDVTNDASAGSVGDYAAEAGACAAIALSTMTTTYAGWFWIYGVCPDLYTSATAKLAENTGLTSAGSIGAMSPFRASTTDGCIALFDADAANTDTCAIGFSLVADSTNANILGNARLYGVGWGV